METKINITAILKDKPQGTKLYDWLHNIDVELDTISTTDTETVVWCTNETNNNTTCHRGYSEFGTERGYPDGLRILFPSKEMRDWTKFSWKKGDVLANGDGDYCVFKEFAHSSYQTSKAVFVKHNKESIQSYSCLLDTKDWHKASHSCTATYINTIEKELSGKLNMETLEIEKQPEFKDGDIIKMTWDKYSAIVIFWEYINFGKGFDSHVFFNINTKIIEYNIHGHTLQDMILRLATEEEKQQLFDTLAKEGKAWDAEKKKIMYLKPKVELRPFDKVLVRDSKSDNWRANLFGYIDKDEYYHCVYANWVYCIPYAGNESLLGTTKDVEG
jgi:hypothetical protein